MGMAMRVLAFTFITVVRGWQMTMVCRIVIRSFRSTVVRVRLLLPLMTASLFNLPVPDSLLVPLCVVGNDRAWS